MQNLDGGFAEAITVIEIYIDVRYYGEWRNEIIRSGF